MCSAKDKQPIIERTGTCSFQITWESTQACPVCEQKDVREIQGKCDPEDNLRKITYEKKKHDSKCILKMTDHSEKGLTSLLSAQDELKFKPYLPRIEQCSVESEIFKDVQRSDSATLFVELVCCLFILVTLCLFITCFRFNRLHEEYTIVAQKVTEDPQIVQKDDSSEQKRKTLSRRQADEEQIGIEL